jgi:hypothetical protein
VSVTLNEEWLGGFKVGRARPSPTMLIRDHLQELAGKPLRLVKQESYGYASGYYLRDKDGRPDAEAQYVMSVDPRLPSLLLGLSVEKGEEVASASAGRRMDRSTWDWPALAGLRTATFDAAIAEAARKTKRPVSVLIWTDREDVDEDWQFTFAWGRWLQRGVPSSVKQVVDRLHGVDKERSRWCDVWIGSELGREEVGVTTLQEAASLLHAFTPLRERLRRRVPRAG